MERKELLTVVQDLNASKLAGEQIPIGLKTDQLTKAFLEAVESVPAAKESKLPDSVVEAYNALVGEGEEEGEKEAPKTKPAKEEKAKAKAKGGKEKAPSAMSEVRRIVTDNPSVTTDQLHAQLTKRGYAVQRVSVNMERTKTLRAMGKTAKPAQKTGKSAKKK